MNIVKWLSIAVYCILLSGCATAGKIVMAPFCITQWGCGGAKEIKDPSKRISNTCVSVLPPRGEGWSIVKESGWVLSDNLTCNPILFGRGDRETYETYIAFVTPFKFPDVASEEEFLEVTRKKYSEIPESERYDVVTFEQGSLMSGREYCSVHSYLVKDKGVPEKYKKGDFMYLELLDVNCLHPYDRNRAMAVSYSHRYSTGEEDPGFREEALEFFNNVQFLE